MNSLEMQTAIFIARAKGARANYYDTGRLERSDPALTDNRCQQCDGDGQLECGSSSNDPDAECWIDECEACAGTGSAQCPVCDRPAPMLLKSTGACSGCEVEE